MKIPSSITSIKYNNIIDYDKYLSQYNFNINVKAVTYGEKVTIEFTLPNNKIPDKIKNDLQNQDFKKGDSSTVSLKKKTRSTFEIKGGNSFEVKVKSLLYILKNYQVDNHPIFEAEYIPIQNTSVPIEILPKYLDIKAYINNNRKEFDKFTTILSTEEVYILVSIYNRETLYKLYDLIQDENHNPQ